MKYLSGPSLKGGENSRRNVLKRTVCKWLGEEVKMRGRYRKGGGESSVYVSSDAEFGWIPR